MLIGEPAQHRRRASTVIYSRYPMKVLSNIIPFGDIVNHVNDEAPGAEWFLPQQPGSSGQ
jgi:hypothetical protein